MDVAEVVIIVVTVVLAVKGLESTVVAFQLLPYFTGPRF